MSLPDLHEGEIELRCDTLLVRLRRDIGGGVSGFWRLDGTAPVPILRAAGTTPRDARELSCFPLVPFCNRIAGGHFVWHGRSVQLEPNASGEEYPLHGGGWRASWDVVERAAERVVLAWHHERDAWPWAFDTQQTITLTNTMLEMRLSLTNMDTEPMPGGLGQHPYFPLTSATRIATEVTHKCETNARSIPTRLVPVPKGNPFGTTSPCGNSLDNTFVGWSGQATLEQSDPPLSIVLTAKPLPAALGVFIAPDSEFLCLEPVTHVPNALNDTDAALPMRTLQPGEQMVLVVRIAVT